MSQGSLTTYSSARSTHDDGLFGGETVFVAGNGPSLNTILQGSIKKSDKIIRVNSFFLEPKYYTGHYIDVAYFSGDPRAAPFMIETLEKSIEQGFYCVGSWYAPNTRVAAIARKIMRSTRELNPPNLPPSLLHDIGNLEIRFDKAMTSGVKALVAAYGWGARHIITSGIDFYNDPERYVYEQGKNMNKLLGKIPDKGGYDNKLHSRELDMAIIERLMEQSDLVLEAAVSSPRLPNVFPIAQKREGENKLCVEKKETINDWVGYTGWYSVHCLYLFRRMRSIFRRLSNIFGASS